MRSSHVAALITLVVLSAYLSSVDKSKGSKNNLALRQPAGRFVTRSTSTKPTDLSPLPPTSKKTALDEKKRLEFEAQKSQFEKVRQCYFSQDCPYPETDPRSYSFAVAKDLQLQLKILRDKFLNESELEESFRQLAHQSLEVLDGHIQSVALEILQQLPPSSQSREAITQALRNNPDPDIVSQAIDQLQRYLGSDQEDSVHLALQNMIGYGPQFSSETAARSLMGFINSRSFQSYLELSQKLPQNSTAAQTLRTYLKEFQRQQSGG